MYVCMYFCFGAKRARKGGLVLMDEKGRGGGMEVNVEKQNLILICG